MIILHIAGRGDWEKARAAGSYQADTLASEGFIHCSRPDQVVQVANTLFQGQSGIVLLAIDTDRLAAEVRHENLEGGTELFPHVYGPLNLDAVVRVIDFESGQGGRFVFPAGLVEIWLSTRPRARELGVAPGVLPPGPLNAITDVEGVRVGHVTLIEGDDVRTGATAILAHGGNLYQDKVPAGVVVGNGYGKLMGSTQVMELGEIETPIVLTNTLAVPRAAEAILDWTLAQPGNEDVRTVNPVVGETNDGHLNDIRRRALTPQVIRRAIEAARGGPIEEGSVGAGTGTCAFGWKGGIGTSSRALAAHLGGYTVGVLVQSNYGGDLQILGLPVGRELGPRTRGDGAGQQGRAWGSIMIVVATDAPLSDRNLTRLARRALAGLARTGAAMSNGSGDYVIAFSAAASVRRTPRRRRGAYTLTELANERMSPLFQAVIEATEEAIYNSLFKATTVSGSRGATAEALPLDRVMALLQTVAIVPRSRSGP